MYRTMLLMPAGPYRHNLQAFLASVPELLLVLTTASITELATAVTQQPSPPDLLILDYALLPAALPPTLRPIPCLALVETLPQLQQSLNKGTDYALLRGFSAADFFIALSALGFTTVFPIQLPNNTTKGVFS